MTTIIPATESLSTVGTDALSLLCYNVLLPNSVKGWWLFKYYQPTTDDPHRAWSHRQYLLRAQLLGVRADIVCVQEAVEESFDADFGFMAEAGYAHILHRKGDQRCATFWRADKLALTAPPLHRDKTLITSLRPVDTPHIQRSVHVINCHLIAGPDIPRRLRQIDEALDSARRELRREGHDPAHAAVIVCGDFNSDPNSAIHHLLCSGDVGPDFRDPEAPHTSLTTKDRHNPFGPFTDAYGAAYAAADRQPPATMLFKALTARFLDPDGALSAPLSEAIDRIFDRFASGTDQMDAEAVDAWILTINRHLQRGSEWDKAQTCFARRGQETLDKHDLHAIYRAELEEGKFWAVHHDLNACGVGEAFAFTDGEQPFAARYDRIYLSQAVCLEAVREPLTDGQRKLVYERGDVLPNAWHPSDHLPVGVVFRWRAEEQHQTT